MDDLNYDGGDIWVEIPLILYNKLSSEDQYSIYIHRFYLLAYNSKIMYDLIHLKLTIRNQNTTPSSKTNLWLCFKYLSPIIKNKPFYDIIIFNNKYDKVKSM